MNLPLVSVALCTYNGSRFIRTQLDSIVNQTYPHLEIICVDDGSLDDTYTILSAFADNDPRLKLYQNTSQLGVNENFHIAFSYCQGSFIAIADQDDIWELNKIETLMNGLGDNLLIYSDSLYINEKGRSLHKTIGLYHNFTEGGRPERFLLQNCVSGHSVLFAKELLSYLSGNHIPIYYDWHLAYIAACLNKLTFTTAILTRYRLHNTSVTGNDKALRDMRARQLSFFLNESVSPTYTKILILKLLENYKVKNTFKRFSFLFTNRKNLYFIRRRSWLSKLKEILKESRVFIDSTL